MVEEMVNTMVAVWCRYHIRSTQGDFFHGTNLLTEYRIHSISGALRVNKTWSWCILMGSKSDLKSMHFSYKNHRAHSFLCAKSVMTKRMSIYWGMTVYFTEYGIQLFIHPWDNMWQNIYNLFLFLLPGSGNTDWPEQASSKWPRRQALWMYKWTCLWLRQLL